MNLDSDRKAIVDQLKKFNDSRYPELYKLNFCRQTLLHTS